MTCKECYHREACGGFLPSDLDKDVWDLCAEGKSDEIPDIEDRCSEFKDKSLIIETPCRVGDTIYKVIFHKSGTGACVEYQVVGFHLGDFPKLRGQKRKQYFIVWHEVTNDISHLDFEQLGKTVFLNREEAEEALKARETK